MKIQRRTLLKLALLITSLALIPMAAFAKKGGGGGGKPGGGGEDPPPASPPDPALVYSEQLNSGLERIVVSNEDGSNKTILYAGDSGRRVTSPEFVSGKDAVVFLDWGSDGALPHTIKYLEYIVSDSGIAVTQVTDVEYRTSGERPSEPSVSGDGKRVVYLIWNGSDNQNLFVKSIDPPNVNAPSEYVWGQSEFPNQNFAIWNMVWLNTPGLIAVSYMREDPLIPGGVAEIQIVDIDADGGPATVGPALRIPDGQRISSANTYDGVALSIPIETGETIKRRGRIINVVEDTVFEWNIGAATFGPKLDGNGNKVVGIDPLYGPMDDRLLIERTGGGDVQIVSLDDGGANTVPGVSPRYGVGDWK